MLPNCHKMKRLPANCEGNPLKMHKKYTCTLLIPVVT